MSDIFEIGLEAELAEKEAEKEEKIITFEEAKKDKMPWHIWKVCGIEYKLVISVDAQLKLEKKYKRNPVDLLADGVPELGVMLTILQAAFIKYHHGIGIEQIKSIYEKWVENEDGSQVDLMKTVIIPVFAVSGFFSYKDSQDLLMDLQAEM